MYVSTFYSYKGGVGRTFAIMNVAVELAKNGRSVLLVDFDLEAPGIDTFAGFENKIDAGGMVQFVSDYIERKVPPDVSGYIYEASIWPDEQLAAKGKIWVMPAGRRNAGYDQLLSKIHWQQLYEEREGFFLFEDLKRQWESEVSPDYVLIDSRTGHTDVGGICTRQLADLVVILFTPNEQNLKGLPPIVKTIRRESDTNLDRRIELCFVASNVPSLDDEEGILRKLMARFQRALSDDNSRSRILTVTRYDSLQLLNQDVFTLLRPKSRLAKQYRDIFQYIVEQNLDDRLGVLDYLKNRVRPEELHKFEDGFVNRRIEGILRRYQSDSEVLMWVARYFKMRSKPSEAISLLEKALLTKNSDSSQIGVAVRLELAETYITSQQLEEASAQLKQIIDRNILDTIQIHRLVRLWRLADLAPSPELVTCINRTDLDADAIELVIHDMSESPEWQQVTAELLLRSGLHAIETNEDLLHSLLLSLIGAGRFELLLEVSTKLIALDPQKVSNLFNVAMATWAANREPNCLAFEQFLKAVDRLDESEDANYFQCVSLAYGVLRNKQTALKYLQKAYELNAEVPISKFSCWRYYDASQAEFDSDLNEIRLFIETGNPLPLFLRDQHIETMESGEPFRE